MFADIFSFLVGHSDLFELIYNAITSGKLSKDSAVRAMKDAIVAEADAEMRKELVKS